MSKNGVVLLSVQTNGYNELSPLKLSDIKSQISKISNKTLEEKSEPIKRLGDALKDKIDSLSIWSLYRFATKRDKIFMWLGVFLAVAGGAIVPLLLMELGNLHEQMVGLGLERYNPYKCGKNGEIEMPSSDFSKNFTDDQNFTDNGKTYSYDTASSNSSEPGYSNETLKRVHDEFLDKASVICIRMSLFALGQLLTLYIIMTLAGIAASRQGFRIRSAFLRSLLHQDIAWFDAQQQENFAVRIIRSLDSVQEGIGERVTLTVLYTLNSVAVMGTAFYYGWKITLVITSCMPILFAAVYATSRIRISFTRKEMQANSTVASVAEESLSGIKTVFAYGAQNRETERYFRGLREVYKLGIRLALLMGVGGGIVWFLGFTSFGTGLWYGSRIILNDRCKPGAMLTSHMLTVILCVLNASISVSQAARNFDAFSSARAAAVKIFQIIDRVPTIDSRSGFGVRPEEPSGRIRFEKVHFHYPLREDVSVLKGLSFSVQPGETVALVGSSGCGKSTVIQLLQRFYDTVSGEVFVEDVDVRNLNVGWLRSQIGLVGQEPVLFEATIAENIALGQPDASPEDIVRAAKTASAHDFIMTMPLQYDTLVGEKGAQLSGGEKQRIAIARALVRNPKILLLDEATSALDSVSESTVQVALDQARKGRTTLVIAHRLSTIRNADRIIVLKDGQVAEMGTHSELMDKKTLYYQYVLTQNERAKESSRELEKLPEHSDEVMLSSDDSNMHYDQRRKSSGNVFKDAILNMSPIKESFDPLSQQPKTFYFRLTRLSHSEWHLLFLGTIASTVVGMCLPFFLVVYCKCVESLSMPKKEGLDRVDELFYQLLLVGASAAVASFFQSVIFGKAAEEQTMRLRKRMFEAILSQKAAWFDDARNGSGALCASLTTDAISVQEATVGRLQNVSQALATLAACLVIEFNRSVNLAMVATAFLPVIVISTQLNKRLFGSSHLQEKLAEQGASKTAVEAIRSIRTVASLHRQDTFIFKFINCMQKPYKEMPKICHFNGLTYGISQSTMAFACVAVIYYGVHLILDGEIQFSNIFETVQAVIISIVVLAEALATMPDYSKSLQAADRILRLISSKPHPDDRRKTKSKKRSYPIHGDITFRNLHFAYPLRPEVKVLRGFNLKIKAGQTVALVGASGCGKSTCVALLERFYDCHRGDLLIDERNIKDYDVNWLRSQIGLVSQEPVLFGISIADNIAYGDNTGNLTFNEIVQAARASNIHKFVEVLPEGYDTRLGGRESWLSGGEKQRVAIARALVRNPKILLLDEATSALDTESEKVVQDALDKARKGRTCIVIAHRLSTIQNADQIVVIREGAVVERGKHYDLMAKKGIYYEIYTMQAASH